MDSKIDTPRSIAADLRTFTNSHVSGQIKDTGALNLGHSAIAQIRRLADPAQHTADSLNKIADNVSSENSRGDTFPGYVYKFVRSMIDKHRNEQAPHYFFVFNPSTTWHPEFDDRNRRYPLGDRFLGYNHDLDQLVAFIVDVARPRLGPFPVVHILIPTISRLAITEALTFPHAIGPFRVTGDLDESHVPFVYACFPQDRDQACLRFIGTLKPKRRWVLLQQVGVMLPIIHRWLSTPLEPIFFEDPPYSVTTTSSLLVYASAYFEIEPIPPRVLGTLR